MTLGDAAKAAGVSRSTLLRAIRAGKVSAIRDEAGAFQIDPAELARVYQIKPASPDAPAPAPVTRLDAEVAKADAALEAQIAGLQALVAELKQSRDDWRDQCQRITLALPKPQAEPEPRRRWWKFG